MQFAEGPQLLDPPNQRPQITAIRPDDLQPAKQVDQRANQIPGGGAYPGGGAGDHYAQQQPQSVHRQMAFGGP